MDIQICKGGENDVPSIIKCCTDEGWKFFDTRQAEFLEAVKHSTLFVAYDNGVFAGFARVLTDMSFTTFLCELLVDKSYRGKGVGKMLVSHIWEAFPNTRIDLLSESDGFYEKIGFRNLGSAYRKSRW